MSTDRRSFIKSVAVAGTAVGLGAMPKLAHGGEPDAEAVGTSTPVGKARVSLNILILGGTGFTGPEQVEYAMARLFRAVPVLDILRLQLGLQRVQEEVVPMVAAP